MSYNGDPARIAHRANQLKADLIAYLGGKCEHCGATHDLQINHKEPRDWQPRKLTHYRRVLRYWREAREGKVDLLCGDCNRVYRPMPGAASTAVSQLF